MIQAIYYKVAKNGIRILELECSCNHCVGVQLEVQLLVVRIT